MGCCLLGPYTAPTILVGRALFCVWGGGAAQGHCGPALCLMASLCSRALLSWLYAQVSDAQEVVLEVFMFACRENATVASPQCEAEVLTALLDPALKSDAALQRLQAAGGPGMG